ncbi:MAG: SMI1/KNR4 family protein [Dysgonomonas sp.]
MAATIEQLKEKLFTELDGTKFDRLKNQLIKKFGTDNRKGVIDIFIHYVKEGQLKHWREFLLTDLIELVDEGEKEYSHFWEENFKNPKLSYWSVDGLLKTKGEEAYPLLINMLDGDYPEGIKNKIVKGLSEYSKQPFDRGLFPDPEHWKAGSRRIDEIMLWQQNGYPNGKGYTHPDRHTSLDNPQNSFEKLMARLDKKVSILRNKDYRQDPAYPRYYLTIADNKDITEITEKWDFPEIYLQFLKYYSPLHVYIKGINIYGAESLIKNQAGYAYHGITGETIRDWPESYVVIADKGADPFCIDLSNISDGDSKVYESKHGTGKWEFEENAPSFIEFIKKLIN